MKDPRRLADALDEALGTGDLDRVLTLARELLARSKTPEHRVAAAQGLVHGGDARRALAVLEALDPAALDEDLREDRAYGLGHCRYALGDPAAAREAFGSLDPVTEEEEADRLWMLGLCHDHLGDRVQADICFREATRIDPAGCAPPAKISADEAEAIVGEVVRTLPEPIRVAIEEVAIVIDDLPPLATIRSSQGEIHPDTLGLYTGQDLGARSSFDPGGLPPVIHIFRRNLERFATDRETLEEEVRTTLLHEIGHHLGLDEDDVDALGLG